MISDLKYRKIDIGRDAIYLLDYINRSRLYSNELHPSQFRSTQDFENYLKNRLKYYFHDFYIITNSEDTLIGFAYAFDYRVYDGHCKICVRAMCDGYDENVTEWINEFGGLLFKSYPLHKLFFSALSCEDSYVEAYRRAGFVQECEIAEYVFHRGQYQNLLVLGKER